MPDKFVKRNGAIYMRVAFMRDGRLDLSEISGMELAPATWQAMLETAMLPETQNLLGTAETAAALGISPARVARLAEQGMPAVDIATEGAERKSLRFDIAACRAWLEENRRYNHQNETKNDEIPVQDPE